MAALSMPELETGGSGLDQDAAIVWADYGQEFGRRSRGNPNPGFENCHPSTPWLGTQRVHKERVQRTAAFHRCGVRMEE